jgi:hypothetical protein
MWPRRKNTHLEDSLEVSPFDATYFSSKMASFFAITVSNVVVGCTGISKAWLHCRRGAHEKPGLGSLGKTGPINLKNRTLLNNRRWKAQPSTKSRERANALSSEDAISKTERRFAHFLFFWASPTHLPSC